MTDLVRIARRCYLPHASADDLVSRCLAAVASSAAYTVVSGITAAVLHGFWLPTLPHPIPIHLATATPDRLGRAMTRTRRPEFVPHRYQLRPEDVAELSGLEITAPPRTWRDLAGVLSVADLVAAGDSVLRSGYGRDALAAAVLVAPRRAYTGRARVAFALLDERSRSRPESHLRVAVSAPDLPRFQVNEPVFRAEGGWLAEPDLSLAEARIALEYQGEHHAELTRMRKDMSRSTDMRREDWMVVYYGPREVFGHPLGIQLDVRRALRQRAPHLLVPTTPRRRRVVS